MIRGNWRKIRFSLGSSISVERRSIRWIFYISNQRLNCDNIISFLILEQKSKHLLSTNYLLVPVSSATPPCQIHKLYWADFLEFVSRKKSLARATMELNRGLTLRLLFWSWLILFFTRLSNTESLFSLTRSWSVDFIVLASLKMWSMQK